MSAPLAIDLYCGLGGWTDGLLAEGYDVIGFDVERHCYGAHRYPAQLVLQDVRTLHGSQFREAALLVASPPCQFFSYTSMPWTRAKRLAEEVRADPVRLNAELALFRACFRIQAEASGAAGRRVPLVVENVKGAQPWVGRARWHHGPYYLWGDVPALMPCCAHRKFNPDRKNHQTKNSGGSWFGIAHNTASARGQNPDGRELMPLTPGFKSRGLNWSDQSRRGQDFTRIAAAQADCGGDGVKYHASGAAWFDTGPASRPSASRRQREASALIAMIPSPLARHIGAVFRPTAMDDAA